MGILVLVVVIAIAGAAIWYFMKSKKDPVEVAKEVVAKAGDAFDDLKDPEK